MGSPAKIPIVATTSDVALASFAPISLRLAQRHERQLQPIPTPSKVSPSWQDQQVFATIPAVRTVVKTLLSTGSLHPVVLRRSLRKFMPSSGMSTSTRTPVHADDRPFANDAAAMLGDTTMFTPGSAPLQDSTAALNSTAILASHRTHCDTCRTCPALRPTLPASSQCNPDCYIHRALLCAENGWAPQFNLADLQPQYACSGNQSSITAFPRSASAEVDRLLTAGKLAMVPNIPVLPYQLYLPCPLGVVVKSSDRHWSRVLTEVMIVDQPTLDTANSALLTMGFKTIKARPVQNATQNGLNKAAYNPSFRFPDLNSALQFVTPSCYLAKGDLSSYFNSFAFADSMRGWFNFLLFGAAYLSIFVFFGFAPAPFYTSGFGAELEVCVRSTGIPCTHYVDDWLTADSTKEEAIARLYHIRDIAVSWGFLWNKSKEEVGQKIAFLGIVIDTVNMVLSFEALSSKAFQIELEKHLTKIINGGHLSSTETSRVCGKLNWFSSVLQAGPIHTRSWYVYSVHGTNLLPQWRERLVKDTEWWIGLLRGWGSGDTGPRNMPILNSAVLEANPNHIHCCASDASGPDGVGYFTGVWSEDNPVYFSRQWYLEEPFLSSTNGELKGLADCINRTTLRNGVLIWLTDSMSAAYVVNKGTCRTWEDTRLVTHIFERADELGIQIFAIWIPREANTLADYLSHLATLSHRKEVSGFVQDLNEEEAGIPYSTSERAYSSDAAYTRA